MQNYRERSFTSLPEYIVLFFVAMGYFLFVSRHRFVDGDEGYYLLASRLVMNGKSLYSDFFFTQAPLLPYVYGLFEKVVGSSWIAARALPAVLSAMIGVMIYGQVRNETGKPLLAAVALLIYASTTFIFSWLPIVKTYSLALLFLFGSYMISSQPQLISEWRGAFAAGVLLGLSVSVRSYFVVVSPILAYWIFSKTREPRKEQIMLVFLCGFATGILPMLYFFMKSPDKFLFNNLIYHSLRSDDGLIGNFQQKIFILWEVFFGREDNGFQFLMLSTASVVAIILNRARADASFLAFLIALALGIISLLPTPTLGQYFCVCVPFLIVSTVCGANSCADFLSNLSKERRALIMVILIGPFVISAISSFRDHLFVGKRVMGLTSVEDAPNWTLENITEVSKAVDEYTNPGETVASFWPGYLFTSKASAYSGFENDFGWAIAEKLTPEKRQKYKISSLNEVHVALQNHIPRVVILGNQYNSGVGLASDYLSFLLANGYEVKKTVGDAHVLVCCTSKKPD